MAWASLRSLQPAFRHPVRIEPARVLLRINVADVRRSLDVPAPLSRGVPGNDAIVERTAPRIPGHRAVGWLRALGESFLTADVPKEKADLMHAIYERITVAGPEIVGVRLTAAAYAHGLALALPQQVEMARPTGVGRALATYEIPIAGRDEWLAAARRPA